MLSTVHQKKDNNNESMGVDLKILQLNNDSPKLNPINNMPELDDEPEDKTPFIINNKDIKLGSISEKQSEAFVKNISENPQMAVTYHKPSKTFVFRDQKNNQDIGFFDYKCVIKSVSKIFDQHNVFLPDIDPVYKHKQSLKLIKKIIGRLERSKKTYKVVVYNYMTSPFMGDVEMLIRLNNDLKNFEEHELSQHLNQLEGSVREKVEHFTKLFIYTLLSYTLDLLAEISEQIKDNPSKEGLAKQIVRYSVFSTYRLSAYSHKQHIDVNSRLDKLEGLIEKSQKIRQIVDKKIDEILKHIKVHNLHLQKITANNRIYEIKGGNVSSYSPKKEFYVDELSDNVQSEDDVKNDAENDVDNDAENDVKDNESSDNESSDNDKSDNEQDDEGEISDKSDSEKAQRIADIVSSSSSHGSEQSKSYMSEILEF